MCKSGEGVEIQSLKFLAFFTCKNDGKKSKIQI